MTRTRQRWSVRAWRGLATCALGLATAASCSDLLTESYRYGTLEVQAVRRTGEPVPGVNVTLYNPSRHTAYGATDDAGRHLFELVPEGAYGIQLIAPPGYAALASLREDVHTDGIPLGQGADTTVSFVFLKKGNGSVRVRLREATGVALPPVELSLYSWEGEFANVAGVQGQHLFEEVPYGSYGVSVLLPSGYTMEDPDAEPFIDQILVDEGSLEEVTFVVASCRGSVLVRVEDPDGQPVSGVGLTFYGWQGKVADSRTNEEGEREFDDLVCGSYGVVLRPVMGFLYSEDRGTGYMDGIVVERDGSETVRLVLEPCSGVVRTRVVDESGEPVAGARVRLYTVHGELVTGTTDADGEYDFTNAPCTRVGVFLFPPDEYSATPGRGGEYYDDIDIVEGSDTLFTFPVRRNSAARRGGR